MTRRRDADPLDDTVRALERERFNHAWWSRRVHEDRSDHLDLGGPDTTESCAKRRLELGKAMRKGVD